MASGSSIFKIAYEIQAVDRFSQTLQKFIQGTAAADRAMRGISRAGGLMMGAGTALGGALVYATTQAALFEREMSAVKAVSGATGTEFNQLSDKAREMGEKTSFSAHEAAEGLKYLALAGWETEQMLAGIEPILYLAEAGNMELGRAADLASDSMAGLGIKAQDTEYYLDRVAQTSRNSNTDINMLMEAFKIGGGTLSALNVPLEESAALFGIMANRGYKGAQAGRAMNAIIQNLTTGFGRAGKAMDEIGVSAFDADGNFRGLEATFRDIIVATKDMNEEDRNRIYAMIAGKEHIKTFMAIVNGLGEEYDTLKLKNINSTGALVEMRNEMKNNLIGALERLLSAVKELAISFGEILLPVVKSAVEGLINIVSAFNNLSDSTKQTIAFVTAIVSAFLLMQGAFLVVFGMVGRLVAAFQALGVSLMAVSALGGVVAGVFGVAAFAGFQAYRKEASKAIDTTLDFGDKVSDTTAEMVDSYRQMATEVASVTRMYADGQIALNEEVASELIAKQKEFHNTSLANVKERQKSELDRTREHLADMKDVNAEERQAIVEKVDEHYNNQAKAMEDANNRIMQIYHHAKEQKRAITQDEITEIEQLRAVSQENTISALAQSLDEQEAIMQAFTERESELTAEQAARAVERSIERKEGIIQAAEEEYEERVAWAKFMNEEIGAISDEEAEKIIENATRKKEEEVAQAEEAHAMILESARERAGEHAEVIDWETGEILSGWELFVSKLSGIWDTVKEVFKSLEPVLQFLKSAFEVSMSAIISVVSKLAPHVQQMVSVVGDMFNHLVDSIKPIVDKLNELWEEHKEKLQAIWNAIVVIFEVAMTIIGTVVSVGFTLLVTIVTGIMDGIMMAIDGALDVIIGIFEAFDAIIQGDWTALWEAVKRIIKGTLKAIIGVVTTFFGGGLLKSLGRIGKNVMSWLRGHVSEVTSGITNAIPNFLSAARLFFQGLPDAIKEKGAEALESLIGWLGDMLSEVAALPGKFKEYALDTVTGWISGFSAKAQEALDKVKGWASDIASSVAGFFQIKSPSRLFMSFGRYTVEGYTKGIDKNRKKSTEAVAKMSREILEVSEKHGKREKELLQKQAWEREDFEAKLRNDLQQAREQGASKQAKSASASQKSVTRIMKEAEIERRDMLQKQAEERLKLIEETNEEAFKMFEDYVEGRKEVGKMSLADEIIYWNEIRRASSQGSKLHTMALDRHQQRVKEIRDVMEKTNDDYTKRALEIDKRLVDETKKLTDEYEKAYESRYNQLVGFKGLFDGFEYKALDEDEILDNMKSQVDAMNMFMNTMSELEDRIDSKPLLDELRKLGVDSVNELHALNRLSDRQLDEYVRMFETKMKLAERQTNIELKPLKDNTAKAIEEMTEAAQYELYFLRVEWQKEIDNIVNGTAKKFDSMYTVGQDAIRGLEEGMKSMESDLRESSKMVAEIVGDTIKDTLKIKSPSRVLMSLGEFVGEGFSIGILEMVSKVAKSAKILAKEARPNIEPFSFDYMLNDSISGNELVVDGGKVTLEMDSEGLTDKLDELIEALEQNRNGNGLDGDGTTINVTIDGKTVSTMRHIEDFFKEIEQEMRKRR